jgi:hypothetical protein
MAIKNGLTEDQIINEIETALRHYNLGDIKKVLGIKLPIAGFILGSCLLDHMASFRYKPKIDQKTGREKGARARYIKFVNQYFSRYGHDGERFYEELRCQLVHGYTSSSTKFAFDLITDDNEPKHNWEAPKDRQRWYLDKFVAELEEVLEEYLHEIKNDPQIRALAVSRYKTNGIFSEHP